MHESVRWQCFSSIEKEPKLPGPTGSLSAGVPSSLDCYERDYNCCYNKGILMVIRLSLMWQLFTNGSIIYIYIWYPCTIALTQNLPSSLHFPIACVMWVWLGVHPGVGMA